MLDILVLAFDEKYKREQIEEFLDLALARQVFTVFYDISSLKKKIWRRRRRNRMESAVRSIIQNTSMTMRDVMELSIPQLEYVLAGCKKNNEEMQAQDSSTYSGADAIQYLIDSGQIE